MQAEELGNTARELKGLIDDSESVIFINLDRYITRIQPNFIHVLLLEHMFFFLVCSHRNVMMRLNLQLTMGTFSLSLFGLIGVAFGMNLESTFEDVNTIYTVTPVSLFLVMLTCGCSRIPEYFGSSQVLCFWEVG